MAEAPPTVVAVKATPPPKKKLTDNLLGKFSVTCDSAFFNGIGFQSFGTGPGSEDRGWVSLGVVQQPPENKKKARCLPASKRTQLQTALRAEFETGDRLCVRAIPMDGMAPTLTVKPTCVCVRYDLWNIIPNIITAVLAKGYRFVMLPFGIVYHPQETFDPLTYEERIVFVLLAEMQQHFPIHHEAIRAKEQTIEAERLKDETEFKKLEAYQAPTAPTERTPEEEKERHLKVVTECRKRLDDRHVKRLAALQEMRDSPPVKLPDQCFFDWAWQTSKGRGFAKTMAKLYPKFAPTPEVSKAWNYWRFPDFHATCKELQIMHQCPEWWWTADRTLVETDALYHAVPEDDAKQVAEAAQQSLSSTLPYAAAVPESQPLPLDPKLKEELFALIGANSMKVMQKSSPALRQSLANLAETLAQSTAQKKDVA